MLPQFDGVRSPHYSWWRYEDGFEEMYDLRRDPFQLTNVASKPAYANKRNKLIAEWDDCATARAQHARCGHPAPSRRGAFGPLGLVG